MKLLTKSTLYFVVTSVIVFLLSGVSIYYMLQKLIREEIDDKLLEKREDFFWELKSAGGFDNYILPRDSSLQINPAISGKVKPLPFFGDTLLYDSAEDELLPYRYVRFSETYKDQTRVISIFQSLIDSDDLVEGIIFSLLIVFVIMIGAIAILNAFGMRHVWRPFRQILQQIKIFDFRKEQGFQLVTTDIQEFNELNAELTQMTAKLTRDYFALKEFSENASHELQTPLAIIQSKLELLLQKQDIDSENLKAVNSAYQAANRLAKLHHELNLMTRIENHEYKDFDSIDLKSHIEKHIENFSDIIGMKNINLETSLNSDYKLLANEYLLEILIANLFNNAIKHNMPGQGMINIELTDNVFTISNSGPEPEYPPAALFERFKKGKNGPESTGLGLALVKQICAFHNFNIRYTYNNKLHIISVEM